MYRRRLRPRLDLARSAATPPSLLHANCGVRYGRRVGGVTAWTVPCERQKEGRGRAIEQSTVRAAGSAHSQSRARIHASRALDRVLRPTLSLSDASLVIAVGTLSRADHQVTLDTAVRGTHRQWATMQPYVCPPFTALRPSSPCASQKPYRAGYNTSALGELAGQRKHNRSAHARRPFSSARRPQW